MDWRNWAARSSLSTVLFIMGCSEGDGSSSLFRPGPALPECPTADYSRCDVRDSACQQRLLELAACVRGSEPPPDLRIDVVTRAEYVELLRDEVEDEESEPAVPHFSRALSLFELAPRDGVPYEEQIEEQAEFVAGQYRDQEKRVLIVDHGRPADSAEVMGVLFHELVHALQDAEHDLESWLAPIPATFDASLAAATVVEGEASFYESRVSAPLLGLDYARVDFEQAFQGFMERALVRAFDSELLMSQSYRTIPYGVGALQAFHAWEGDGPSGLKPLWSEPPLTMQRVLSETFLKNTPQASGIDVPPPEVPEGLTLYGDDSLGAWGLCLVLTKRDDIPARVGDYVDSSLRWRGDRFSVYTDEKDATYALWQLELDSTRAAQALDDFFGELPVDHGVEGNRVFVSYNMNDRPASEALTTWAQSWLASGRD